MTIRKRLGLSGRSTRRTKTETKLDFCVQMLPDCTDMVSFVSFCKTSKNAELGTQFRQLFVMNEFDPQHNTSPHFAAQWATTNPTRLQQHCCNAQT